MKKRISRICFFGALLVLGGSVAEAAGSQIRASLNTIYFSKKDEFTINGVSSTSDVRTQYNDVLLGYVFSNQLYFGAIYASDSIETAVSSTTTVKELINHTGLSFGYSGDSWFFLAHYFLSGTYVPSDTQRWSDPGGSVQLDFGYAFPLSQSFHLGLQGTYRKLSYKVFESSGNKISNSSYTRTEMIPMIDLIFTF